ncbi:MAG TPA: TolC family protein [Bacteroidota bacterium]|nr:TolC family protein [Bacteroidota bacterium]
MINRRYKTLFLFLLLAAVSPPALFAQPRSDTLRMPESLENCIRYAVLHQPLVRQAQLDERIAERTIQGKLADWFPQLTFSFNVQHNPQLPTAIVSGIPIKQGLANSSNAQFNVSQTLFNRDVLLASTSAHDIRAFAAERSTSTQIDVVINVSRAFYAVLVTKKQIELLDEAIIRLEQSYKDAYTKYQGGIVDKTDYMRATIALNNARADRRQADELLRVRYASLREQMGYPPDARLELQYDSTQLEREAWVDTLSSLKYEKRIEYQLLQTQVRLQEDNLDYNIWGFLPSIAFYGSYTLNYQNSLMSPLYNQNYPYSFVGLQFSFPIFEGGKRIQQIGQAKAQLDRSVFDLALLRSSMTTQYTQAMANYKSNLNNYRVLTEDLELAQDVYRTIQLQYKAGTRSYLEFISAETDLRTAQENQTNSLYQVLLSKLDVQRALGTVPYYSPEEN